jgi:hypothetical protein
LPFRQLFTKREQHFYEGVKKEQMVEKASSFWYQSRFSVSFPAQFQIHGENVETKIGLRQVVDVWVIDSGSSVTVDLMFSAMLGDQETAVGVVGAIIILPVAAVVGAVSYLEYENDARNLMNTFWGYLDSLATSMGGRMTQPSPPTTVSAGSVPGPPCPKCGLTTEGDAIFCKRCGERLPGR